MKTMKRWCTVLSVWMVCGMMVAAQQPTRQDEFVPIDQLPPQEQLAAAPLLIGAYAFVLVVLFLYVYSVARRLTNVQREIERLDTTIKQGGRA
jgi:CcmD family protein